MSILRQVEDKKFKKTELLERFNQSSPPKLTFVDINTNNLKGGISEIGQKAILDDYASQVLSMVFINRRGFAPEYRCSECDWVARCNNCETNMVFHHEKNRLICHRCDSAYGIPELCPDCGNSELGGVGLMPLRVYRNTYKTIPRLIGARFIDLTVIQLKKRAL